jgi:hypothetical protein
LDFFFENYEKINQKHFNYFITTAFVHDRTFFLLFFLALFRLIFFLAKSTVPGKKYQFVNRRICWASGVPVDAQKLQNSNHRAAMVNRNPTEIIFWKSFGFLAWVRSPGWQIFFFYFFI